jgi:hypothetical protein
MKCLKGLNDNKRNKKKKRVIRAGPGLLVWEGFVSSVHDDVDGGLLPVKVFPGGS